MFGFTNSRLNYSAIESILANVTRPYSPNRFSNPIYAFQMPEAHELKSFMKKCKMADRDCDFRYKQSDHLKSLSWVREK